MDLKLHLYFSDYKEELAILLVLISQFDFSHLSTTISNCSDELFTTAPKLYEFKHKY